MRPEKIRLARAAPQTDSQPIPDGADNAEGADGANNARAATAAVADAAQTADAASAAHAPFNRVLGRVADIAYFGSFTLYRLTLPSGQTLKVSRSNDQPGLAESLRPGDPAWASWSPDAMVVLSS